MEKKIHSRKKLFLIIWLLLIAAILVAIFIVGFPEEGKSESIKELMKDGVLHDKNKISLFGMEVNPALISAYIVTAVLLFLALLVRIFAIPRFQYVPGKFQSMIEKAVEFFAQMAKSNSSRGLGFVGAYIFCAGIYIFFSTIFELFGVQATTSQGILIALPAPLADINAAIAMGVTSFTVILGAGIVMNGLPGAGRVLKDFSLPISMSFRLFGALLSGLLVTELVYYFLPLSFGLPVIVGIMFTLLHALIQAYVLTTLVSVFYGEAVEKHDTKKHGTEESGTKENGTKKHGTEENGTKENGTKENGTEESGTKKRGTKKKNSK